MSPSMRPLRSTMGETELCPALRFRPWPLGVLLGDDGIMGSELSPSPSSDVGDKGWRLRSSDATLARILRPVMG